MNNLIFVQHQIFARLAKKSLPRHYFWRIFRSSENFEDASVTKAAYKKGAWKSAEKYFLAVHRANKIDNESRLSILIALILRAYQYRSSSDGIYGLVKCNSLFQWAEHSSDMHPSKHRVIDI